MHSRVRTNRLVRSLYPDQIADGILAQLEQGDLKPGDRLPTELELAKEFGVGRTSVREALKALELMGLLHRSNAGTFVADSSDNRLRGAFAIYWVTQGQQLEHLYEVRRVVEVAASGLAAERATEDDILLLERIQSRLDSISHADKDSRRVLDTEFHLQTAKAARNAYLYELCLLIHDAKNKSLAKYRRRLGKGFYSWGASNRRLLIAAIRRRDALEARRLTEEMLIQSELTFRELMAVQANPQGGTGDRDDPNKPQ